MSIISHHGFGDILRITVFSRILVSSFISINSRCRREMGASQSTYDEDDYDNNYGEEDNEEMPVNVHLV